MPTSKEDILIRENNFMAGVRLENITKVFDKKITAVDEFNLEVRDNEVMVIAGPSGCGKTTTLRIIAGLEKQDSGNVYIDSKLANDIPPRDRDIAMVFQNFALYPHFSVFENIAFPLKMRKVNKTEIEQQVVQTAKLLGIANLLARRPHTLSGGQRQRVAVARAIVRNPKVFLYDEPLSNLDAQLRLSMRTELKELHNRLHTATIYVTHDQNEAIAVGDRICVMKDGKIRQVGTPVEIYQMPSDRFVASFFGTPAMNFFTGQLSLKNDSPVFSFGNCQLTLSAGLKDSAVGNLNRQVVLGIRPEHISFNPIAGQAGNCIEAAVEYVEYQGQRKNIFFLGDCGEKFVVSCDLRRPIRNGDKAKLYFDVDYILLFEDGPDGKTIASFSIPN